MSCVRTKIPIISTDEEATNNDEEVRRKDGKEKDKAKVYTDKKRKAAERHLRVRDKVSELISCKEILDNERNTAFGGRRRLYHRRTITARCNHETTNNNLKEQPQETTPTQRIPSLNRHHSQRLEDPQEKDLHRTILSTKK